MKEQTDLHIFKKVQQFEMNFTVKNFLKRVIMLKSLHKSKSFSLFKLFRILKEQTDLHIFGKGTAI